MSTNVNVDNITAGVKHTAKIQSAATAVLANLDSQFQTDLDALVSRIQGWCTCM